jgi:trigger factor
MLVTVESTGTLGRRMRVELPAERIEKEIESRLKSVGRTAKIKGFRPGKIPAKVVRQRYGGQIRQEVLSDLMQKSYSDAVIQENLNPAGGPKIEPDAAENDEGFAYVATFEVLPEITLEGLDKIAVTKPEVEIADEDCDEMIHNLRKQKALWSTVDRQSKKGDRVIVDFTGTLKGEPIEGGQGKEVPVDLGEGRMLPEFEKALESSKAGDEKSVKVKFPKDYHDDALASKKVDFTIKVHRVEEEELPPLDDTLAELYDVKEGGLATLRADVRANMEREAKQRVAGEIKEQALNGLLDANPIEIPNSLKEQEIHSLQHDTMRRLGIEDHDQAPPAENFAEAAERRVRLGLLVRQLIKDNNLSVDADRVRKHVEEMCASYENPEDMVAMYMSNEQAIARIEPMVLEDQAVEWLTENGVVKSRKVGFKEYMNN